MGILTAVGVFIKEMAASGDCKPLLLAVALAVDAWLGLMPVAGAKMTCKRVESDLHRMVRSTVCNDHRLPAVVQSYLEIQGLRSDRCCLGVDSMQNRYCSAVPDSLICCSELRKQRCCQKLTAEVLCPLIHQTRL